MAVVGEQIKRIIDLNIFNYINEKSCKKIIHNIYPFSSYNLFITKLI